MPELDTGEGLPSHYRAWSWQAGSEPVALRLDEHPLVTPGIGDVLVRNLAIGLNPVDWKVLGGTRFGWRPGHVPGVDGAGLVVAIGEGVSPLWLGQAVAYHQDLRRHGSFAEFSLVRAEVLLRIPQGIDFAVAASLPCPALTAWLALDKLPLRPGGKLLLGGAGGSVGSFLLQLANRLDWHVTAVSHPRHRERLLGLGARAHVAGPLPDDGSDLTGELGQFAASIDTNGPTSAERLSAALGSNGHLVCIQGRIERWPCERSTRAISMHEVALGALHRHGDATDWQRLREAGEDILRNVGDGTLEAETLIERPFAELPTLLHALRHRTFSGKPVIRV